MPATVRNTTACNCLGIANQPRIGTGDDADAQQAMHSTAAAASSTPPEHAGCQNMTTFPKAVHDVFGWDDLLSPAEVQLRYKVRAFMVCV